jgi:hypothetical protein
VFVQPISSGKITAQIPQTTYATVARHGSQSGVPKPYTQDKTVEAGRDYGSRAMGQHGTHGSTVRNHLAEWYASTSYGRSKGPPTPYTTPTGVPSQADMYARYYGNQAINPSEAYSTRGYAQPGQYFTTNDWYPITQTASYLLNQCYVQSYNPQTYSGSVPSETMVSISQQTLNDLLLYNQWLESNLRYAIHLGWKSPKRTL